MPNLNFEFFARDTLEVARDLIGVILVVGDCQGRIVETEAYTTDAASHSVMRRHKAAMMTETFGHIYIYKIYGIHYCLNFTTDRHGTGAVLIRAVEPLKGMAKMAERRGTTDRHKLASGPGNLCQAFGIGIEWNGLPIGREIKLRPGAHAPVVSCGRRIGITRATDLDWRFYELGNACVSRQSGRKADAGERNGETERPRKLRGPTSESRPG